MEGWRCDNSRDGRGSLSASRKGNSGWVALFGAKGDPQIRRVRGAIVERGGQVFHLDSVAFPESVIVSVDEERIRVNGKPCPAPIHSVYLRSLGTSHRAPDLARELKQRPHGLLAQLDECGSLTVSAVLALESQGARLVNSPDVNAQHGRKPYQLRLLHTAGLPVPRFLASNDPKAVRAFVKRVKRAVYKPLAGGATVQEVEAGDLNDERLAALAYAPVLFQELIEGTSVRVYVVGNRVVAAGEIHSRELDYRRGEDAVLATKVSAAERRAALTAARACSMRFSGVDLIRTTRGFVVLECNPSPMFAVFEEKTGLDVAGPLAQYLLDP